MHGIWRLVATLDDKNEVPSLGLSMEGSTPHHCWSAERGPFFVAWRGPPAAGRSGHVKKGVTTVASLKYVDRTRSRNSEKLSPVLTRTEMGFWRRTLSGTLSEIPSFGPKMDAGAACNSSFCPLVINMAFPWLENPNFEWEIWENHP